MGLELELEMKNQATGVVLNEPAGEGLRPIKLAISGGHKLRRKN